MPWPKGKLKPKEFKERVSETLLKQRGVPNRECLYCGQSFKPKYPAQRYCSRLCANRANPPPKGVPIIQCLTPQAKEKNRLSHIGKHFSSAVNKKKGLPGMLNPFFGKHHSPKTRKVMSRKAKARCQDPKFWERWLESRMKRINSPEYRAWFVNMLIEKVNLKPNKAEQKLLKLLNIYCPTEWRYTGDGQVVLGGFIPDYINCNGRKLIIELFGDHWHNPEDENAKRDTYKKFGYKLLVVWEHEMKDQHAVIVKVKQFMEENGD